MSWYSEYCISTGEFTGRSFDIQEDANLTAHCAEGCSMVAGMFDRATHRVVSASAVPREEPLPEDLDALRAVALRRREVLLRGSDWVRLRAMDQGEPVPPEWLAYRQSLRDITEQSGFPRTVVWPTAPARAD